LLEDLKAGEKIWVWKSPATTTIERIQPLLTTLRQFGPNVLLWVVQGDEQHPPGTIEQIEADLIKGYIERFAPYDNAPDIRPYSWFRVCQATYDLCRGPKVAAQPEAEVVQPEPATVRTDIETAVRQDAAEDVPAPTPPRPRRGLLGWLGALFRRR